MKIKWLILFVILFFVLFFLSAAYSIYTNKTSFLTLTYNYPKESFTYFQTGEILSGNKAAGEFTAHDNNLGIVAVRFLTYRKISADVFIFRLKEKGSSEWYYENMYKAREFGGYPLFPFGFPIIGNSKGKQYYFELESLYGRPGRAVEIGREEPAIVVKHKFNISQLLNDKKELSLFIIKKSKEILEDRNIFLTFIESYFIIVSSFFILMVLRKFILSRVIAKKLVLQSIKKTQTQSQIEARWLLRFFLKLKIVLHYIKRVCGFLLWFVVKKLFSFHRWLGKK